MDNSHAVNSAYLKKGGLTPQGYPTAHPGQRAKYPPGRGITKLVLTSDNGNRIERSTEGAIMEVAGGSLAEVSATGDQLATLQVLRDVIAAKIDRTKSAREVAVLSARLMDVLRLIGECVPAPTGATPLDELERRRAARSNRSTTL
ncbi:hypothetical protein C1M55_10395 [Rhodococcus qingshengii]|nr:hypothetical protein C1M55_10395 [Rhodococcus qingshengii]